MNNDKPKDPPAESATDWDRLENMTDAERERAAEKSAKEDADAAPILSDEQMKEYKVAPPKVRR